MVILEPERILSSVEVRSNLSFIVAGFRRDATARPVTFGSHRRPEAVLVSYSQYEQLLNRLEDAEIAATVRERLATGEPETIELEELFAQVGLGRE